MKGKMTIILDDELIDGVYDKIDISEAYDEDDTYIICLRPTIDESIASIITDHDNIHEFLNNTYFYSRISDNESINLYELAKSKIGDFSLFNDCQRVNIFGDFINIQKYIELNPFLQNKEVVICEIEDLDFQLYQKLKSLFGKYPNVKFKINGNSECITLQEYEKTILAIEEIVNRIKKYNFSPFESMIYAYDIVRDRFYVKENEDEKSTISRDLSSVLLGDKIVCLGFSRVYNAILEKLNIPSIIFTLSENYGENRHARVLAYLKDSKYDINGLYFFDPTFDCKKDDTNSFLQKYLYFAKTRKQMDLFSGYKFNYEKYDFISEDKIEELEETCEEEYPSSYDILKIFPISRINHILRLMNIEEINPTNKKNTKESLINTLYTISDAMSISIPSKTFIEALYKVRKIQFYEEPSKYPFNQEAFKDILLKSRFDTLDNDSERMFYILTGHCHISNQLSQEKIETYLKDKNIDLERKRVLLAKTLRLLSSLKEKEEERILKKQ